jgi:hypothetical protein
MLEIELVIRMGQAPLEDRLNDIVKMIPKD